jgi:cytidylate kinase
VLAERLGLEVHDRDIIHRIAEDAHIREDRVVTLEEEDRPLLTDLLVSLSSATFLSRYSYVQHLTRVVESLAGLGGAVILGRGAHLILGPGRALRVFVVAPLEARVATVMARHGIDAHEAARRISEKEAARRAFLRNYFRADFGDPATFDLVVNTGVLGVPGAADAIQAGLTRLTAAAARSA